MTTLNVLVEAAKLVEYDKDGAVVPVKTAIDISAEIFSDLTEARRKQGISISSSSCAAALAAAKRRKQSAEEEEDEEEEEEIEAKRRRPGGAGTRETHNKLEKNRRAELKNYFQKLKQNLPKLNDRPKASNVSILSEAAKYLEELKYTDKQYEAERLRLRRCRMCLEERISMLKEDIHRQHLQNQLFAQVEQEKKLVSSTPKEMTSVQVQANEQDIKAELPHEGTDNYTQPVMATDHISVTVDNDDSLAALSAISYASAKSNDSSVERAATLITLSNYVSSAPRPYKINATTTNVKPWGNLSSSSKVKHKLKVFDSEDTDSEDELKIVVDED